MWKQFIDRWKQLFDSDEREIAEDEFNEERKETPTYRSSEAKSKMTYHYPKTGSFRFPVIPDTSVTENATPKDASSSSLNKNASRKQHGKENNTSEYRKERSNSRSKNSSEKKRPTPSEEPFVPTVVPSPIYGFQHQKASEEHSGDSVSKDTEVLEENELTVTPEPEKKPFHEQEDDIKHPFPSISEEEEDKEDTDDIVTENLHLSIEQEETRPVSEPVTDPEETETEESVEPETVTEAEELVEPEEDEEVIETEVVPETEEVVLNDEVEIDSSDEGSEIKDAPLVEEEQPGSARVQKDEDETQETVVKKKSTPSGRKENKQKSSVPFNVIMTPRDKRSRSRAQKTEDTSEAPAEKDEPDPAPSVTSSHEKRGEAEHKLSARTEYQLPLHLFNDRVTQEENEDHIIREQMEQLEKTLQQFQVKAKVTDAMKGPAVTRFEVQPEPGVKVSKITKLSDDIKLGMAAKDIRMEAPIPGKQAVGIEVPNKKSQIVGLQEIFETDDFTKSDSPLTVGLGLDIAGIPSVTNLKDMPHGLIAGATGSGKSVCINTILLSLLYKSHYEDVKFMLIDPKMVELAPYNGLPHLVSPVITDVKAAATALKWAVQEMEDRYEKFVEYGVRDVEKFNEKVKREGKEEEKLPYLVIVIDELADLMMTSPQDVEDAICKIAQKARACGIHLLVATQRPSVDVITGLIKANIPTRIAFSVSSQADSRTVLDSGGAEKLLGKGDMLFIGNGDRVPKRIQGAFVSDDEITRVTNHMKKIAPANYLFEQNDLLKQIDSEEKTDVLFDEAVEFVLTQNGASASLIQRRFRVGYNRAARLIDQMEQHGIISEQNGSKPREVLWSEKKFEEWRHGETS
ncbi:DNA translocase FtsK [Salimicrobium flavidum]|uniref:DNA translocase FtsK n=1 Tax=Salimicrobium flavidum TaxID=570947 RepID=A0A1N7JSJ8_9BACI|nr:DNA translocase FtsK [Salimicrobium flavidum]SIS52349.1 DNA translocase FtsK [Salimicrobium flavidum]